MISHIREHAAEYLIGLLLVIVAALYSDIRERMGETEARLNAEVERRVRIEVQSVIDAQQEAAIRELRWAAGNKAVGPYFPVSAR